VRCGYLDGDRAAARISRFGHGDGGCRYSPDRHPFGASGYIVRYAALAETGDILVTLIWHGREARI
jgi:hypothetical protein